MINKEEEIRYQRQLILPKFGKNAQLKLKNSKVFVAGAGGLGGPVCYYLAAAGVGHLVIADKDEVDLSNLNRQILHTSSDIGISKTRSAYKKLSELNPNINVETHHANISNSNIANLVAEADIMVDCLDNISTRLVLNKYSLQAGVPIMHAGIDGWNGQLTLIHPPETVCLNCLFEATADTDEQKPVLGAVVGIIGTMQALETIKYLTSKSTLKNTLLYFDALSLECTKLPIQKNTNCTVCGKN